MRQTYANKQREQQFKNSFSVNQICLQTYNALQDPYLKGFFDKPYLKHHLKQMSIIKRRRKSASNAFSQGAYTKRPLTSDPNHAIMYTSNNYMKVNKVRLPNIDNVQQINQKNDKVYMQKYPRTASTSHRKRKIKSVQKSQQYSRNSARVPQINANNSKDF